MNYHIADLNKVAQRRFAIQPPRHAVAAQACKWGRKLTEQFQAVDDTTLGRVAGGLLGCHYASTRARMKVSEPHQGRGAAVLRTNYNTNVAAVTTRRQHRIAPSSCRSGRALRLRAASLMSPCGGSRAVQEVWGRLQG